MPDSTHQSLRWYDSYWLKSYVNAKGYLNSQSSELKDKFESRMSVFKTNPQFKTKTFKNFLSPSKLNDLGVFVKGLDDSVMENHEFNNFGRKVVHDHRLINILQEEYCSFVSEQVGEEVEPSYNFLSLYGDKGRCPMHMDAPSSKWTLDICIDSSDLWPIYLSEVQEWPENFLNSQLDLGKAVSYLYKFEKVNLCPGDAVLFSGSSQWHYRKALKKRAGQFCNLVFLHYVPKGSNSISEPSNWYKEFNFPKSLRLFGNDAGSYDVKDLSVEF